MVRFIISLLFLGFLNVNAQQYIARNGKIIFFSEAPLEDISAVNNKVSTVYDAESKDLVFQLRISDFIFPNSLSSFSVNSSAIFSLTTILFVAAQACPFIKSLPRIDSDTT